MSILKQLYECKISFILSKCYIKGVKILLSRADMFLKIYNKYVKQNLSC